MTFTKEQLIARAETVLSNARTAADFQDSKPYHLMDVHLAEIALAALEAEPALYCMGGDTLDEENASTSKAVVDGWVDEWNGEGRCPGEPQYRTIPLYTAPPAPVSAPDALANDIDSDDLPLLWGYKNGWNACRSVMLRGKEKPVSQRYRLPDDFDFDHFNDPVWFEAIIYLDNMYDPVTRTLATVALALNRKLDKPELSVWYGSMPESNGKSNWTAILHRKGECLSTGITIERSEYPERVRYEADRVRHIIGELKEQPDILSYDADAHSGYVEPVSQRYKLPDGYVLVPVEPTKEMVDAGWSYYMTTKAPSSLGVYAAMLAAAPQQ